MNYLEGVDEFLLLKVEQYSLETGAPLSECINEALTEWLEDVADSRLQAFRELLRKEEQTKRTTKAKIAKTA